MTAPNPPLFWFDAHLDLAFMAEAGRDMTSPDPATAGGEDGPGCITFPSLQSAGVKWAVATIFTQTHAPDKPYGYGDWADVNGARNAAVAQLEQYQQWENDGLLRIVKTKADLDASPAANAPIQIIILMEGADPIASNDDAAWWFAQGVRIVTLCWTHGSRYAAGNGMPSAQGGLTSAGQSLITKLDELGVIHDLTHLNDAAAGQLMHMTTGSVIATHSASRTMQAGSPIKVDSVDPDTVAQRHITDSMLKQLADRESCVGLPLYARFLTQADEGRPSLNRVADHVEYLATKLTNSNASGRTRVGLGSDYDGGFSANDTPVSLDSPEKLANLASLLTARGWSTKDVQAFAHDNWLRYFKAALPG